MVSFEYYRRGSIEFAFRREPESAFERKSDSDSFKMESDEPYLTGARYVSDDV